MATHDSKAGNKNLELVAKMMKSIDIAMFTTVGAGGYPVSLGAGVVLPPIAPFDPSVFALLRWLHRTLAYLLFATVLLHLAAALYHGLIRRDGVLRSMVWRRGMRDGGALLPASGEAGTSSVEDASAR